MNLAKLLTITNDSHALLESGAVTVNLQNDESDYWHLSDYAVSSRSGMMMMLHPKNNAPARHADNGWKYHYPI